LDEIELFDPKPAGERSPKFQHLKQLIVLITMLSVQLKIKTHLPIHKMATEYWDHIAFGLNFKPISKRQLRNRFKK
jgi:hypothetical protein